jgi:putative lipase involved disintegration of autophagic bodies
MAGKGTNQSEIEIHSGFHNAVNILLPDIKGEISKVLASAPVQHVICTGHSAGGAIASLVFMHLLNLTEDTCTIPVAPMI